MAWAGSFSNSERSPAIRTPSVRPASRHDGLTGLARASTTGANSENVPFVDSYHPLRGHDQWRTDLAASSVPHHPGQAGYGLIAWLVLHNGWTDWLQIT